MKKRHTSIAVCPHCHRIVTIRKDGRYGKHRLPNSIKVCLISESRP